MRILFLSTWFPYPPDNGSKLRVYYLLRALCRAHQVTLLSFAFDTADPAGAAGLREWCEDAHVVQLDPFKVNRASALRTFLSPTPVAMRPVPQMHAALATVTSGREFDAVIASTGVVATYALRAGQPTVKILEEHNSLSRWMAERRAGRASLPERVRRWASWQKTRRYEAQLFSRFDLVTMVSQQDADASRKLPGFKGRVEVIPNGVDTAHNQLVLRPAGPRSLVYNGSLTYSANYDAMVWFLAEVYPLIKARVPAVTLAITGSTAGVALSGLALDPSVTLTGYVDDIRVPVAEAAVCVAPIRQGGGTRLKILEAMALGTPVVATSKGAEGLDVVSGEHLLISDDAARFASAVTSLLDDARLRARLTGNARRLVESCYDWEQIGAQFTQLVEHMVTEKLATIKGNT